MREGGSLGKTWPTKIRDLTDIFFILWGIESDLKGKSACYTGVRSCIRCGVQISSIQVREEHGHMPVTPVLWEMEQEDPGGLLTTNLQGRMVSSRFSQRPCLKVIRWKVT